MPFPRIDNTIRPNKRRLQPGEKYCEACWAIVRGMTFKDANSRMVCMDCAGKLADPFR